MIKKYCTFIVLFFSSVVIFFTSGCQSSPSKQTSLPGGPVSNFPKMMVGDSWVTKEFSKKGIVTRNRTIIETKSDGSFVEEVKDDKGRTLHEYYNNRYQRVISINVEKGSALKISKPPAKTLEFPLFVGKKWNDQFDAWKRSNIRHFTNEYIVDKYERINTKAGSFKAFKIIRLGSIPEKSWKGKEEYWYSPKAKRIVRSVPDWRYGSELLSYKLALADRTPKVEKPKKEHKKPKNKISEQVQTSKSSKYNAVSGVKWAVVIGVSSYNDTRIPNLRYASADAKSFYNWLISPKGGRYAPARIKLLLNEKATYENMKDAICLWLKQALSEDTVVIYFAGHGSPDSPDSPDNLFLLPHDVKYDRISVTGFPMWDIESALKRFIKSKKVVIITDACHSGGVGQSFDMVRRGGRGIKAVNPISTGFRNLSQVSDGVCVITASDEKQYSQESQKWGGGHGVFTYFLLKGLNGEADYNNNNSVTLGELTSYISQKVRRATQNAQSPIVAGRYDPALVIGR